jgi:acyl carrier protein
MTQISDMKSTVLDVLGTIAPEADLDEIDTSADLQDELDIDSIDFLNLMLGLHERTGIDIPERDYAKVATLDSCVAYLAARRS